MKIKFDKYSDGLVPAIIQDVSTRSVLMLGFMNEEAYLKTLETKKVTFFSRSKNRIWTKGEESGNYLNLVEILNDCDQDTLLIKVNPLGVVCHTGSATCWNESNHGDFLFMLEAIIKERKNENDETSYTASLFKKGINKIAQKVGEEAVETIIEAKDDNINLFLNESADLLFHYMVLLQAKNCCLNDVISILKERHIKK
jgi:phosphoribosyl-ATP pyrophosphohydrolase/phosphoribosyl-AMP cyclohydrolase